MCVCEVERECMRVRVCVRESESVCVLKSLIDNLVTSLE